MIEERMQFEPLLMKRHFSQMIRIFGPRHYTIIITTSSSPQNENTFLTPGAPPLLVNPLGTAAEVAPSIGSNLLSQLAYSTGNLHRKAGKVSAGGVGDDGDL